MRSKLFVPGSRPELFAKALAGDADAIALDLEDAVQESRKAEARTAVGRALSSAEFTASKKTIIVRVNGLATPHFEADLAAVFGARLDLVNVPKVESAADIRAVVKSLARLEAQLGLTRPIGILANIESPRGLRLAAEIAGANPRVAGLQLGFGDLFSPLGIDRTDAAAVHQVQLAVRLAAGEAGIWAYDAAFAAIGDPDGYKREAQAARRLGFLGKTCIHPSQVPLANEVFRPGDEEMAQALRVVAAADEAERNGTGAFTLDGRMLDAPFIKRARTVAAIARQLQSIPGK
jgi:citrate lyase subunit beta/citryl-CoA lyase